jgi:hypothetical protein
MDFKLSQKYKDFLRYNKAELEILEGTTASGKTTTGMVKFLFMVAQNNQKLHIISGQNLGIVEKNIINCELGILDIFGDTVSYHPKGKGKNGLPHIKYKPTEDDEKIIYILGYDNTSRWKYALGGQYGCIYIDEINTADMAYVRQAVMRCDYLMGTLNPDDPDKDIYKEYINRCRPIEKYKDDGPSGLLEMLDEPEMPRWVWWYFSFDHNAGLTEEKKEKIKRTHSEGTIDHLHYVLGMRGKAEGIIFDNFDKKKHCITYKDSLALVKQKPPQDEYYIQFTAGLDTSYSKNSNDTIAMSFMGITNKKNLYLLDEVVLNNKDEKVPFAPSDVVRKFVDFLEKNRETYGFARDVFVDSADQATMTELKKFKVNTGSIYNFLNAHKALKIIDRIQLQKGWFATGNMFIVNTCENYIRELKTYSWSDKKNKTEPEDANDHMINSVQYAWIPFKTIIGN